MPVTVEGITPTDRKIKINTLQSKNRHKRDKKLQHHVVETQENLTPFLVELKINIIQCGFKVEKRFTLQM